MAVLRTVPKSPWVASVVLAIGTLALPSPLLPMRQTAKSLRLPPADLSMAIGGKSRPKNPDPIVATSPDASYGKGPGSYRVEAVGTKGMRLSLVAHWGDAKGRPWLPTEAESSRSRVIANLYGFDGVWRLISVKEFAGGWQKGRAVVPAVRFELEKCRFEKVRLGMLAWRLTSKGTRQYERVSCRIDNLDW